MEPVQLVRQEFVNRFGAEPEGVWEAPGRVNLIGEHTDYNGGLCLPIALPHRTWAAASRRQDERVCLFSLDMVQPVAVSLAEIGPGTPKGWGLYPLGVLFALREAGYQVSGMNIVLHSTVPIGAGLSSSAALEASVAAAASDLFGLGLLANDTGRNILAGVCQRAENHIAQAPTGGMDQAAALRCQPGHALLLDCLDNSVRHVPVDLAAHGLVLLIVDTRAKHALVDGQYGQRRADCEASATILGVDFLRHVPMADLAQALDKLSSERLVKRARHVVTEIDRVFQAEKAFAVDDYVEIGKLFNASHASLRDDFEVSCVELDVVCEAALGSGALGARMTGGGFGGSAIALVPEDKVADVSAAVRAAFAENGLGEPRIFEAVAAEPARRSAG